MENEENCNQKSIQIYEPIPILRCQLNLINRKKDETHKKSFTNSNQEQQPKKSNGKKVTVVIVLEKSNSIRSNKSVAVFWGWLHCLHVNNVSKNAARRSLLRISAIISLIS